MNMTENSLFHCYVVYCAGNFVTVVSYWQWSHKRSWWCQGFAAVWGKNLVVSVRGPISAQWRCKQDFVFHLFM